jgi:hypothetical protein
MTNTSSLLMSGASLYYSYQQHFKQAINNFDEVVREERLQKRIQKSRQKIAKA